MNFRLIITTLLSLGCILGFLTFINIIPTFSDIQAKEDRTVFDTDKVITDLKYAKVSVEGTHWYFCDTAFDSITVRNIKREKKAILVDVEIEGKNPTQDKISGYFRIVYKKIEYADETKWIAADVENLHLKIRDDLSEKQRKVKEHEKKMLLESLDRKLQEIDEQTRQQKPAQRNLGGTDKIEK